VHPEHSQPAQLARELERDARLLEPVPDVRHDALADERAHRVADVALLVGEELVDPEEVGRANVGRRRRGGRHAKRGSLTQDFRNSRID
jgi:hypothetical protein